MPRIVFASTSNGERGGGRGLALCLLSRMLGRLGGCAAHQLQKTVSEMRTCSFLLSFC